MNRPGLIRSELENFNNKIQCRLMLRTFPSQIGHGPKETNRGKLVGSDYRAKCICFII